MPLYRPSAGNGVMAAARLAGKRGGWRGGPHRRRGQGRMAVAGAGYTKGEQVPPRAMAPIPSAAAVVAAVDSSMAAMAAMPPAVFSIRVH